MAAIYATLGPAQVVADSLREHNVLEMALWVALILFVGSIIALWIKRPPGWRDIGVALGVALAYLIVFIRIQNSAERTHLIEYGIVAGLIHQALLIRVRNGHHVPMPAALTVAVTATLGLFDEIIQATLPTRTFDVRDIFFNAFAAFMVIIARLAIAPQRRPGWRIWFLWLISSAWGWGTAVEITGLGELAFQSEPPRILSAYLGVVGAGILVGTLQWLILRKEIVRSFQWVLPSFGAMALFGIVIFGAGLGWVIGIGLLGTLVGVLQWLVLKQRIPRAGWWILASTLGWIAGIPAGSVVGWNGLGAVYGAITGLALVLLLRHKNTIRPH